MSATQPDSANPVGLSHRMGPAGRWSVAGSVSTARFQVRDKLAWTVRGSMPVESGAVVISPEGEVTEAWVDLSVVGIATGNAHRDRDLCRRGLLDAESHPTVRVAVRQGRSTPTGWTARAVVLARGAEAPVDLLVETVAESGDDIRVRVSGRLDRKPLGIQPPTFIIGRYLDLEADLMFRRETDRV